MFIAIKIAFAVNDLQPDPKLYYPASGHPRPIVLPLWNGVELLTCLDESA